MTDSRATRSPSPPLDEVLSAAREWAEHDPDPHTRAELTELISRAAADRAAETELRDRFAGSLQFGTAGLRAQMGAGPNRINQVIVAQSSAGFAHFLQDRARAAGRTDSPRVVIGFDGRTNSDCFAQIAASVFEHAGVRVSLLDEATPTPILAFAVRHLQADAGVMITASHNPPRDNGYKVYLGGSDHGSQIIPPADTEIQARIADYAHTWVAELVGGSKSREVEGHSAVEPLSASDLYEEYAAQTSAAITELLGRSGTPQHSADLRIAYTAMHGVGYAVTARLFEALHVPAPAVTESQNHPDGRFPTLEFPNPEEPGAMDEVFATATASGADLVLAHDPDADRLAVAYLDADGAYCTLNGNELGLILAWVVAERWRKARPEAPGALANTLVSSPALEQVAAHFKLDFTQTLNGFKWVSRVPNLIYGFEEALGYLVTPSVLGDKDGISAAALIAKVAAELRARGETLGSLLGQIHRECGEYTSTQVTLRFGHHEEVAELMHRVRSDAPSRFGEVTVTQTSDFATGSFSPVPANLIRFDLADGSRVMMRPSGTEPKLKVYLDARVNHTGATTGGPPTGPQTMAEHPLASLERAVRGYITDMTETEQRND